MGLSVVAIHERVYFSGKVRPRISADCTASGRCSEGKLLQRALLMGNVRESLSHSPPRNDVGSSYTTKAQLTRDQSKELEGTQKLPDMRANSADKRSGNLIKNADEKGRPLAEWDAHKKGPTRNAC